MATPRLRPIAKATRLLLHARSSSAVLRPPALRVCSSPQNHLFSSLTGSSSVFPSISKEKSLPPYTPELDKGLDLNHWFVFMENKPEGDRDQIIDTYIKTLAKVVGSEEEARMKIYNVSTRFCFGFGALISGDLPYELSELPGVHSVDPDFYTDEEKKDYGGEPFINGQAVPYDPKYHKNSEETSMLLGKEWLRSQSVKSHTFGLVGEKSFPPYTPELDKGLDLNHWFVFMENKPEGDRDQIIDTYIKTLAKVVGSEEEARMKIYSVSTRFCFGFGALISGDLPYELSELPEVFAVDPDFYKDDEKQVYGGEPFINGQAVPYDPKYHEDCKLYYVLARIKWLRSQSA